MLFKNYQRMAHVAKRESRERASSRRQQTSTRTELHRCPPSPAAASCRQDHTTLCRPSTAKHTQKRRCLPPSPPSARPQPDPMLSNARTCRKDVHLCAGRGHRLVLDFLRRPQPSRVRTEHRPGSHVSARKEAASGDRRSPWLHKICAHPAARPLIPHAHAQRRDCKGYQLSAEDSHVGGRRERRIDAAVAAAWRGLAQRRVDLVIAAAEAAVEADQSCGVCVAARAAATVAQQPLEGALKLLFAAGAHGGLSGGSISAAARGRGCCVWGACM
eukprot:357272-Chlamydomonas_euryale.AAC.5